MKNTIFVRNLTIRGTHGQSAHLRERLFLIDMEITLGNIDKAIANDDLTETFDYRQAVAIAREIIASPPVHLIETLVSQIADKILKFEKVEKIKLTLTKREWSEDFDSGITVERIS